MYDWLGRQVYSPYGLYILALLFFFESMFFVPADPLLILFCVENKHRAFFYATLATVASVLGGVAAYYIGFFMWSLMGKQLVGLLCSPEKFATLCDQYRANQTWAVLIGGFAPVPYKLVTLTAGFCELPLIPFILCSIIARGARFYLIAGVVFLWGKSIKLLIDRYFNLLIISFTLLICLGFFVLQ